MSARITRMVQDPQDAGSFQWVPRRWASWWEAVTLCEVPIGAVEEELVVLAGQLAAGTCRWLLLLAEFDRREGWAAGGITSCGHWLSIRLDRASLVARWDDQGTATIRCRIPTDDAAVVMAAIEHQVKTLDLPAAMPVDARRAMALVELAKLGAEATAPSRDKPLVHITIPLADLEAGTGGTIDGRPIADATVRRMLCDGSVVGVVLDEHGQPVAVGNKTRVPSTKTRRCVDVRDGKRCTYPGCPRPAEDYHHVEHWVDAHRTDVEILTSLCRHHHRTHHRGGYAIDLDPDTGKVRFTRPDRSPILLRAETAGTAHDIATRFPTEPDTLPTRWDGSPIFLAELTPPAKEHTNPTTLHFASWRPPDEIATLLAHTLGCRFTHEGAIWMTSTPDLITITPDPDGDGTHVTIDLTTRPTHLQITLNTIGLTDTTPHPPPSPDDG